MRDAWELVRESPGEFALDVLLAAGGVAALYAALLLGRAFGFGS